MDRAAVKALIERAKKAFADKPGIVHISYGLKLVDNKVTDTPSLRVTVKRKIPESELPPEALLPESFEGIPVDVLEPRSGQLIHCQDTRQYSRMIGGITISTKAANGRMSGRGTLGFFARINNVADPDNIVLLSNNHVLTSNGGTAGTTVYQPASRDLGNTTTVDQSTDKAIAKIHSVGFHENRSFTYPGETPEDFYVDAATAKLNFSISSLCKCFTGTKFANKVRDLNVGQPQPSDKITGQSRITDADVNQPSGILVKVGRSTHRTVGQVVAAFEQINVEDGQGNVIVSAQNVIEIAPIGNDCDGLAQFCAPGDSGSVVVNDQGQVVGLLFLRGSGASNDGFGYACHIDPVLEELDIELISTARPPVGPAGEASSLATAQIVHVDPEMKALETRVMSNPAFRPLYLGFMDHWDEIVALVNGRRPLLVAWHRLKGPVFMAHLSESARRPGHSVPRCIEGVSRRELLSTMADLLIAEGSAELGGYLQSVRDRTLAMAEHIDDLHGFVRDRVPEPADG